jgi:hypothetical protein
VSCMSWGVTRGPVRWAGAFMGLESWSVEAQCQVDVSYPTQSFLSVFRSLATLEKTVEQCCISLNGRSTRLVVQLHCKYGE